MFLHCKNTRSGVVPEEQLSWIPNQSLSFLVLCIHDSFFWSFRVMPDFLKNVKFWLASSEFLRTEKLPRKKQITVLLLIQSFLLTSSDFFFLIPGKTAIIIFSTASLVQTTLFIIPPLNSSPMRRRILSSQLWAGTHFTQYLIILCNDPTKLVTILSLLQM